MINQGSRRRRFSWGIPASFGVFVDDAVAAGEKIGIFSLSHGNLGAVGQSELKLVDVGLSEARAAAPLQSLDDVDPECRSLDAAQDLDISRVP